MVRLLGAGRIVGTGRNDETLREVLALGADAAIDTAVPDDVLARAFTDAMDGGYDVVLDVLCGRPPKFSCGHSFPMS